mmetsp:Transcript_17722/g.52119  ORF Transcript_17722/g.52119 Transcript_17722/m.52119 type:complete len:264 (-) Transcript_17722:92-883(-)
MAGASEDGMVVNCEHLLKFVAEAKEEGNAAFKARKYSDALTAWQAGLDAIAQADGRPMLVEDMRLVVVVRSVLHSNRGQALMKMEFWRRAIKDLDEAIRIDGENVKALWRRSKAHEALKEWGQAEADVEALLSPRLQEVAGPLLVDAGLDAPKLEEARARLRGCRDEAERVAEETFEERAEDAAHRGITELRERFEQVTRRNGLRGNTELAGELADMVTRPGGVTAAFVAGVYQIEEEDAEIMLEWVRKACMMQDELHMQRVV